MVFAYTTLPTVPPRPYLEVVLRSGFRTAPPIVALVDSGADRPIFPREMAVEFLGLDLTEARAWNFYGTDGVLQKAKLADVRMAVLNPEDTSHAFEVSTTCAFCDTFAFPAAGGILGQEGFFSKFKVNFFQPYKYFEIDPWPAASVHPIQSR